ncbi:MAG: tRNA lysidine(34) synthetase TilS [Phycisphaerae bacterium]|nr:tRNA lysidine(34) synthetase TilS [Phycisphaerae bacterium]MBI70091.1 tRNA lysidine(34) synthetase TilS [Phycisphaerae bacterium]
MPSALHEWHDGHRTTDVPFIMNKDVIPHEVRKNKLVANVRRMTQDEDCVIAVSGGADSMALLALATAAVMQESASFQVTVAHVHHGLRAASDDELKLVEDVCRRFNIQFLSARLQVTQKDGSLASGAREARYDALAEIAEQVGAKRVLTAHHADDQLETMLMALCRGGGLNQLAGMAKERPLNESVTLARPLLDVRKETLVDICTACLIPWCEDPTNKSLDTPRGKLRQSVIPTLRELYPSADKHATNASVLLHGLLQERASLIPQGLAWERAELSQFEHAIVSEAVHCALGTNATFETVQSIADAVKDDSTHERTFTCANGYIAKVTAHTVEVIHAN